MACLSGCLMSSTSNQKLFCGICLAFKCSFDEFVGEKVVSPSYSSAILGLPLGQVILKDKFLSQCASDIRIKFQQLQKQDPDASLDETVQTATNTVCNRKQEREAKAQEREKRKEKRHAQMATLLGSPMAHPESLKDKARGKCLICRQAVHWDKECSN